MHSKRFQSDNLETASHCHYYEDDAEVVEEVLATKKRMTERPRVNNYRMSDEIKL